MKRRWNARGTSVAVLLSLVVAMATAAAAEPAAEPSVAASPSPGGESSGPSAQTPGLQPARRRVPHRPGRSSAEARFQALAKGLKLDAAQQAEVRRVLQDQREALRRLASAPADAAIPRVAAIHAINDRTAARIRAVLNDEQKKLYGQPLPRDVGAGKGKPGVEDWQKALRRKDT